MQREGEAQSVNGGPAAATVGGQQQTDFAAAAAAAASAFEQLQNLAQLQAVIVFVCCVRGRGSLTVCMCALDRKKCASWRKRMRLCDCK